MRRRGFLGVLGGAAAWPLAARAQTPSKIPHVGVLDFFSSAASAEFLSSFHEGLRELGHRDGQNIRVEYHSAEQRSERAAELAADFVRRNVDVIVAVATPAAHAVKQATASIPIVITVADPLATGLVSNLARPGGNITGMSTTATDLAGKRLELLRELRPDTARIAFLGATNDPNTRTFVRETAAAATSLGVQLQPVLVTGPEEFEAAFATMVKERADGLIVQPLFLGHREKLTELALRARIPMIARSAAVCRIRCACDLRQRPAQGAQEARLVYRPGSQRGQTGRPADRAADAISSRYQHQNREGARADGAFEALVHRRRGDRLIFVMSPPAHSDQIAALQYSGRYWSKSGHREALALFLTGAAVPRHDQ